ncbi:MAG TPA: Ig-like domain-containing protein [Pirellulales bacterium]|nr:Ig-like domain-containing protein [Pirellulales bacterium]
MLATAGANFLTVDTFAGGQQGIAVTGVSPSAGGVWQYSANGTSWTTIAGVALNQALLLPASDQLRFWPNPGFAGVASITFYGWDQVVGTAGTTADLSGPGATGGFSSFSTTSATATLNVKLVNQPPQFTLATNQSVLENNTVIANGGSPGGSNAAPISLTNFVTGISPGQPIEIQSPFSQTVTFTVTTDRPDLFSVQPTLDPAAPGATTSTLHFSLNPDVFGVATISVVAHDNGGTANGGNDTSLVATTTLTVALINDPPSLNPIPNQSILENAAQQTLNLSGIASGLGESQNLTVTATSDNPSVVPNPTITYTSPNTTATLKYAPVAFNSGIAHITVTVHDDGGTANGGIDSFSQTFTVNVQFVNQPPSFVKGPDQAVNEDSPLQVIPGWATQISPGQGNAEPGQTLNFIVTPDNPNIFVVPPSIDPATGTLRYQFAQNFSGSTNVSVKLHDNGGTANGGVDTSASQSFKLTSNFVNDIPTFVAGGDQTVNENAPAQTVVGWATSISPGPGFNEAGQTLNFIVTAENSSLFAAGPSIDPQTGTLTYTPALNAFGTTTVHVRLHDNGGTANGGIDTSAEQTFTITVNFVNHAPSFVGGPNQVVNENAPAQTVTGWAKQISPGPASESTEQLTFLVTTDNNNLFSTPPAIDPVTGTLTYTPQPFAAGVATVTVKLKDNAGTANGGVDTSPPQTFKITVNFVNQAPSFTIGPDQTVNENAPPQTVTNFATNISPGPGAKEVGQALNFIVTNDNNGLFVSQPTIDPLTGTLRYSLTPHASGTANVTVQLHDNGGTVNGGVDTSAKQVFKIVAGFVNHAPSFVMVGGDQFVTENTGAHVAPNFVSQLSAGIDAIEAAQTLNFQVANNDNALFSVQPSINAATGALTYTLAPGQFGAATVTVALHDNGGTANGGVDTSPTQTFKIFVNAPPTAQPDFLEISYAKTSSSTAAIGVLSNDTDPNGDPLTAVLVSPPAYGSFLLHADGSFNYTPGASFRGLDQFTYMANDGHANSNAVTVRIMSHDASNVRKLYEQVLNRDPDDAGLQYWTNLIQNGSSLAVVAQGIIESDERLNPIITNYYSQFLLRTPDASGLAYWRDQVWKVYGGPEPVIAGMISSPEFFASAGGTNKAWVQALYQRLLNRAADSQGLQYWDNLLDTHQMTERDVVNSFLSSDEYYTNLIDGFFQEYLGRPPHTDELASDLAQLHGGVSDRAIQLGIVVTDEYKNTPPPPPLGGMKRLTH